MSIEFEHPSERKEVEIAQVRSSQHMQEPAQRDIGLRTQARVRIEQGLVGQVQDQEIAILATRVRVAPALHTFQDATRQSKVFRPHTETVEASTRRGIEVSTKELIHRTSLLNQVTSEHAPTKQSAWIQAAARVSERQLGHPQVLLFDENRKQLSRRNVEEEVKLLVERETNSTSNQDAVDPVVCNACNRNTGTTEAEARHDLCAERNQQEPEGILRGKQGDELNISRLVTVEMQVLIWMWLPLILGLESSPGGELAHLR